MWSIDCCIGLSTYGRFVRQTKFNGNCHCTKTERSCRVRSVRSEITVEHVFNSSEYEQLAIRLLQCLYLSNPTMARLALKRENFEFNKLSSLEVASMCEDLSKEMNSHGEMI